MFKPVRIFATIIFLVSIGLIFLGSFVYELYVGSSYDPLKFQLLTHALPIYLVPVSQ